MTEKKINLNEGSVQKGGKNPSQSQVVSRPPPPTPTRPSGGKNSKTVAVPVDYLVLTEYHSKS